MSPANDNFPLNIADGFEANLFGRKVQTYQSLASTNDVAKRLAETKDSHGTIIVADQQTGGRGRRGTPWHSPPGVGIWFSVVLREEDSIDRLGFYALAAGYSVAGAIEACTGISADLKWPNDVMLLGKKVSGILIESILLENRCNCVVVGVGVNANQESFSGHLAETAISVRQCVGITISRRRLFIDIIRELESNYVRIRNDETQQICKAWKQKCSAIGKPVFVTVGGQSTTGIFADLDATGRMIVATDDGGQMAVNSNTHVQYQELYNAARY